MAIFYMLLAAMFVSISNLFMRKSIDQGGTTRGFLVFQMFVAMLVAILLNPVRTGVYSTTSPMVFLGIVAGCCLSGLLFFLGKALTKGPPGITFSILNGATVIPAVVMALVFGSIHGFLYTPWHAVGSLLVLGGLFWAGKGLGTQAERKSWMGFAVLMFSFHVVILVLYQYRALLLNTPNLGVVTTLFAKEDLLSTWFMPAMYGTAFVVQGALFAIYEARSFRMLEVVYGVFGGVANGLCTYFMIWATEVAGPLENAVIYPIFSVANILLSNAWGQKLYQEKVHWRACHLSAAGLILGTVDWASLFAWVGL